MRPASSPIPGLAYVGLAAMSAIFGHGALLMYRSGGAFALPSQATLALLLFAAVFAGAVAAGHRGRARIEWFALAALLVLVAFVRPLRPVLLLGFLVLPFCKLRTFPIAQPYQFLLAAFFTGLALYLRGRDIADLAIAFFYLLLLAHPHNAEAHPSSIPGFGAIEAARRRAWERIVTGFRVLPAWARFGLLVVLVNFGLHLLFRCFFWSVYSPTVELPHDGSIPQAWWVGIRFDLRVAILAAIPAVPLALIPRAGRGLAFGYLLLTAVVTIILYVVDLGHYGWLDQRVNSRVLDELNHAKISADVVGESYPVVPGVSGMLVAFALYALVLWRTAFAEQKVPGAAIPTWGRVAVVPGLLLPLAVICHGKIDQFPLRWSDAYFSTNSFVSAFALNPVHHFFDTMNSVEEGYDIAEVRKHYPEVAAYLGVKEPDLETLTFQRRETPQAKVPGRPNVVIIFLESFAAFKVGCMGNPTGATPEFDALAKRSILYRHFYVPAGPTARSIWSTVTGVPDVNPNESATRNPFIVQQHTLVNAFEGYDKHYFVGVSGAWGNIRGLLCHNIEGLQLHESVRSEPYDLFFLERAHQTLAGPRERPFFAILQTSGNHSPYTIPEDRRGFEVKDADVAWLRENGFEKVGEELAAWNSLRFLDYSIGNFMRLASREPWFDNTIFVLFGDHGTSSRHGLPDAESKLVRHQVPCIIFAPKFFEPRVVDRVASSLDILPTLADVMGVPHVNQGLGRSLWDDRLPRYAYIDEGWHHGLLDDEFYLVLAGGRRTLYRYREDLATDCAARFPEKAAEMERLCLGLRHTSRYLLYHNKPVK